MLPKEKFEYLFKMCFMSFGALLALFGAIYILATLKFNVFTLIGAILCFSFSGVFGILAYLLAKEYNYKRKQ